MKYRYRYMDQIVDMIEGSNDPAVKMAIIWANQNNPNLSALVHLLYDYRWNFEITHVPKYKRNRTGGTEIHTAIGALERRLNEGKLVGANTKFKWLIDTLERLQDRDAEVLERALTNQINFRIPIEDIQRAYPDIKTGPNFSLKKESVKSLDDIKYPATIVYQPSTPEVRVVINSLGNFKFVDCKGKGLVLPDKPNSPFVNVFKGLRNIVISAGFHGLTKDHSKIGNTATTNSVFAKFQAGELESDTISLKILDAVDLWSYVYYPDKHPKMPLPFAKRWDWINNQSWGGDSIYCSVADSVKVATAEDLRKLENEVATTKDTLRVYSDSALWGDGFQIIDKSAF